MSILNKRTGENDHRCVASLCRFLLLAVEHLLFERAGTASHWVWWTTRPAVGLGLTALSFQDIIRISKRQLVEMGHTVPCEEHTRAF